MAGWDSHVNHLKQYPAVTSAGLFGLDGNPWATSADFKPSQQEVAKLVQIVSDANADRSNIRVCGSKFMGIAPPDDGLITLVEIGASEKKRVCTVSKFKSGVIIGLGESTNGGPLREALDKYCKYLAGIGY